MSVFLASLFSSNAHILRKRSNDIENIHSQYLTGIIEILGMNQLLWYYADLEKQACLDDTRVNNNASMTAIPGRKSSKVNI